MRAKPNIPKMPYDNRSRLRNLIQNVIQDVTTYAYVPDQVILIDGLITIVLWNKKFLVEEMKISSPKDYTDVYLHGIKQSSNIYDIGINGENIVISFGTEICYTQTDLTTIDFLVKGKIVSI